MGAWEHGSERMKKALDRLWWVVWHTDMTYTEVFMSVLYLGWAVSLLILNPGQFSNSASYRPLSENAPQWVFGWVFLVTGLLKGVGVLTRTRWMRAAGALLGTFLWAFVGAAFVLTGVSFSSQLVYVMFGVTCFLTLVRQARTVKALDRRQRSRAEVSEC